MGSARGRDGEVPLTVRRSKGGDLWGFLPFRRGRKKPTREEALKAIPVRNDLLRWYKEDGEVNLFIPRKRGGFAELVARVFRLPDEKRLQLDRVGSGVWELCDGYHDVQSILDYVQRRHKLTRREAEVSVSTYLKILAERRLIGLKAPESASRKAKCRSNNTG
jgi:hypothetical protein